ncbi:MAG: hypothetical protein QF515_08105 [Pseudomonadales bacterium]|nr:hypothetical protein [Pseudomonadales bacterium]MDP6470156.1 hypothetical protein [Pseudomonadales bacterium]MDP6827062.1 hypothetical protein [Pseudomonadales bacterium]
MQIEGTTHVRFNFVREALADGFEYKREVGAVVAVYLDGEPVAAI